MRDRKWEVTGKVRKDFNEIVLCPRCNARILDLGHAGSLSRKDNRTEICSICGQEEAIIDLRNYLSSEEISP